MDLGMSSSKPCAMPERRIAPAPAASDIGVLPLDALREILLRLQAKELRRLRLVCRQWRSLLSDPCFAAAHDARHQLALIIAGYRDDAGSDVLVNIMDLPGQIVKKVRRIEGDGAVSVSLDGVCLRKIYDICSSCRLFNPMRQESLLDPATGDVYRIPDNCAEEHVELASSLTFTFKYLFGQVARTGEHKMFRMLFHFSLGIGHRQMFEVCTLNSRVAAVQGGEQHLLNKSFR